MWIISKSTFFIKKKRPYSINAKHMNSLTYVACIELSIPALINIFDIKLL